MNVYDFDGTIYDGDSTIDFYIYCLMRYPRILKATWQQITGTLLYVFGKIDKTAWKEAFFSFVKFLPDIDQIINQFCNDHGKKIADWYRIKKRQDDVIISASPYFLVEPFCRREGITRVIATKVDKFSGKILGKNCKGKEKVIRFRECYDLSEIDSFFSDSRSDEPIARYAKKSYYVKGNKIKRWDLK